jgi:hypothetical protein
MKSIQEFLEVWNTCTHSLRTVILEGGSSFLADGFNFTGTYFTFVRDRRFVISIYLEDIKRIV